MRKTPKMQLWEHTYIHSIENNGRPYLRRDQFLGKEKKNDRMWIGHGTHRVVIIIIIPCHITCHANFTGRYLDDPLCFRYYNCKVEPCMYTLIGALWMSQRRHVALPIWTKVDQRPWSWHGNAGWGQTCLPLASVWSSRGSAHMGGIVLCIISLVLQASAIG